MSQNEVKRIKVAAKAAQAAYKEALTPEESKRLNLASEGLDPIRIPSEFDDKSSDHKFRADANIDAKNKKIIIGISGTRIDQGAKKGKADLWDDFLLALGKDPKKLKSVDIFLDKVIDAMLAQKINDFKIEKATAEHKDINNMDPKSRQKCLNDTILSEEQKSKIKKDLFDGYSLDFTGHSLGAVLSDCAAAKMYTKLKSRGISTEKVKLSSVTFDNPGAKTPVKKIAKAAEMKYSDIQNSIDYKVFNNRKNFINTLDQQVGKKYRIMPDGQKPRNSLLLMLGWVAKKMPGKYIKKVVSFLSFGSIVRQVKDHGLNNFDQVIVQEEGVVKSGGKYMTLDQAVTGIEPLEYEKEIFDNIKATLPPSYEEEVKPQFSMKDDEGNVVEFTKQDLKAAFNVEEKKSFASRVKRVFSSKDKARGIIKKGAKDKNSEELTTDSLEVIEEEPKNLPELFASGKIKPSQIKSSQKTASEKAKPKEKNTKNSKYQYSKLIKKRSAREVLNLGKAQDASSNISI